MKRKIIRSVIALIWAALSIVQFSHNDITMGVIYGAVSVVFLISLFANKNKQN